MDDKLIVVCYIGGTCGDLISAMIDPIDAEFRANTVWHNPERTRLKKPHLFDNDLDKDRYINDVGNRYSSISSHDLDYHVKSGHEFISIVTDKFNVALWAARRFKKLHRPHVWEEMQRACGASTIEDYAQTLIDYSTMVKKYTNKVLDLESIYCGSVIQNLQPWLAKPIGKPSQNLYKNWIDLQKDHWPKL
jgi:hypothetical protein